MPADTHSGRMRNGMLESLKKILFRPVPINSPAAILFDVDGTLMDDNRAVLRALASFHASHGSKLGISPDELVTR